MPDLNTRFCNGLLISIITNKLIIIIMVIVILLVVVHCTTPDKGNKLEERE